MLAVYSRRVSSYWVLLIAFYKNFGAMWWEEIFIEARIVSWLLQWVVNRCWGNISEISVEKGQTISKVLEMASTNNGLSSLQIISSVKLSSLLLCYNPGYRPCKIFKLSSLLLCYNPGYRPCKIFKLSSLLFCVLHRTCSSYRPCMNEWDDEQHVASSIAASPMQSIRSFAKIL
jgi:hypothetical protein